MVTKDTEYNMLRQEILGLITIQNTYIVAMYTITITIIGIGLERKSNVLFLLPYIILFSFQRIISAKKDGYIRIAAYIAVYLEEGDGWEKQYQNLTDQIANISKRKKKKVMIKSIITGRISSLQLGLLCSCMSIGMSIANRKWMLYKITIEDFAIICLAVVLFVLLYNFSKDSLNTMEQRNILKLWKRKKQRQIKVSLKKNLVLKISPFLP